MKKNRKYRSARRGFYQVKNIEKCLNKGSNFVLNYKSNLERMFMKFLDESDFVLKWGYEIEEIEYFNILDRQKHNYIVDFKVYFKDDGSESGYRVVLFEIKSKKEKAISEKIRGINEGTYNRKIKISDEEFKTGLINDSKWKFASEWAKRKGWEFVVLNEEDVQKLFKRR